MAIGLDIGTKSVKIVEVTREGGKPTLKAAGIVGMPDVSVEKLQNESEYSSLAGIIKKLFADAKITNKSVNLSLPEPLVFTRSLRLPLLTDAEIDSAVKWQAEDIIPIPIKEAIVQHIILERNETALPFLP